MDPGEQVRPVVSFVLMKTSDGISYRLGLSATRQRDGVIWSGLRGRVRLAVPGPVRGPIWQEIRTRLSRK